MEWTGQLYADTPTVTVRTLVEAPPARVWTYVSDIQLMPRLSEELRSVHWLDDATGPALGARFLGRNSHRAMGTWETISTIVEFEPGRRFAWAVGDPEFPSGVWRFTLSPEGDGTVVEQWTQMGPARSGLSYAIDAMPEKEQKIVFVRLREFESAMTANLAAIKELAERES